jgi:26S proteasome regulatory subunit N8
VPTNHISVRHQDGTTTSKTFVHTPSIIEAEEAEEIGVEHLLRDIRDVANYLQKVLDGQLPVNHAILGNLQDVFNLLPNLSTPKHGSAKGETELQYALSVKTNDQLMAIYLSSLIRAITAFHDLIENKIQNRQQQEEKDAAKKEEGEKKEGSPAANGEGKEGGEKEKEGGKEKKK